MNLAYSERLLLLKALIVQRTPDSRRITHQLLLEALQADLNKIRIDRPDLYYNHDSATIETEIEICVEEGLIEGEASRDNRIMFTRKTLRRTSLGNLFLKTLENKLAQALEEVPMSNTHILDFLGLV